MNYYTNLARRAVEKFVKERVVITEKEVSNLPENLFSECAGVFVTIYRDDQLRGCIGTFLPTQQNICQEIIANAVASSCNDYRFTPITKEELPFLRYEVNIINTPEPIMDKFGLNPKKFGVIVSTEDGRRGLLLPNLTGINTIDQQIAIACQKAGFNPKKEKIHLQRFTTTKYCEDSKT